MLKKVEVLVGKLGEALEYQYNKRDYDVKQQVKGVIKEKFRKRVAFPFIMIDDKEALIGFAESD